MTALDGAGLARGIAGRIGLPRDGVLIVHCGFRGASRKGARAEAFIEGLLEHLRDGTLLMPAMSWRIVTREKPFFDEIETPSHVGVVAETFRLAYASHRSIHPTHSVAAAGRLAREMTDGHQHGDTPCPPHSPFGRLKDVDAAILMFGVGFESCTAIHCAEEAVAPDFYLAPEVEDYDCRDRHGVVHRVRTRRHPRLARDFPKFETRLQAAGGLHQGEAAGARWIACRARDLDAIVMAALVRRRDATLAGCD